MLSIVCCSQGVLLLMFAMLLQPLLLNSGAFAQWLDDAELL
jgi:hypothetical protein